MKPIETLPDYPALRQVQNALWRIGDVHGAAVMVGAGFSRFATRASESSPLPPLWNDFRDVMQGELYPDGNGPADPLALAEEYRAALGPHALENLIRSRVRDSEWMPGNLHQELLRLPWSDVLTTNWDTLLERTATSDADLSFDVVRVCSDIARTRSPRIVKLHGSLPSHGPFIFTEEDFRTYPRNFAPFVNLAQQVLLENELCLVGFSGEDPNFLEWAGWVRDQLGQNARPIRLIGVLKLSPSRRRLLEARHITPIDLTPLVADIPSEDQQRHAMQLVLDSLKRLRPHSKTEWNCEPHNKYSLEKLPDATARVEHLTQIWHKDRKAHPGWLVTPSSKRRFLYFPYEASQVLRNDLVSAPEAERATLLYEAVWRWETGFNPLPDFVERSASELVALDGDRHLDMARRVHLRTAIVRAARRRRDWSAFDIRIGMLDALDAPQGATEASYQRCLRARDQLDYAYLAANLSKIAGDDPVWQLRRAALAADALDSETAAELIAKAYREIRQRRAQDRRSTWLLSREAWAAWLRRVARFAGFSRPDEGEWPLEYKSAEIDPWDELQAIEDQLGKAERKLLEDVERRPLFDAGRYISYSREKYQSGEYFFDAYSNIIFLCEHVGIPIRADTVNILESNLGRAIALLPIEDETVLWEAARAISSHDRGLIDHAFNRTAIARISRDTLDSLVKQLRRAVDYGRLRLSTIAEDGTIKYNTRWISKLRVHLEILSRLSVRAHSDDALDMLRLGLGLSADPNVTHWWLFESLGHLMERSIQALEPTKHSIAALEALRLPIPSEKQLIGLERDWPEIADEIRKEAWRERAPEHEWASRIRVLVAAVEANSDKLSRGRATIRLFNMAAAGALREDEAAAFGTALWAHCDAEGMPTDTDMLPHVFLKLPNPDPVQAARAFQSTVIAKLITGDISQDRFYALHGASFSLDGKYQRYELSSSDAGAILDQILLLRQQAAEHSGKQKRSSSHDAEAFDALGIALADTILPALSAITLGPERAQALIECCSMPKFASMLMALPALTLVNPSLSSMAVQAVQRALLSRDAHVAGFALGAVHRFIRIAKEGDSAVPSRIVDETVSLCVMRREPGLLAALQCAQGLVSVGAATDDSISRLCEALDSLLTEAAYDNWRDAQRSSDVGLIRSACVKLAAAIKHRGSMEPVLDIWLSQQTTDPMPEVRYALRPQTEA